MKLAIGKDVIMGKGDGDKYEDEKKSDGKMTGSPPVNRSGAPH